MIPKTSSAALTEVEFETQPGLTYALDVETNRIHGKVDGIEAMRQAVELILSTERYRYLIYSWNYGVELAELIGKPLAFVLPEIERRVSEALLQDDRITAVDGFDFETFGRIVHCSFTVHTIYGDFSTEREVNV